MKNIQSWIVKNKVITAILLAAVVLALGLILAFNQTDEESTQELAANQEGSASGSEIANQDDLAIQEIGQIQSTPNNCEQNAPEGYEQRCFQDGCPQGGWFTRNDTGTCGQSEAVCCRKAIPVEGAVNCGDLGGSCSIGGCAANYKDAGACPAAGLTCCVPQQEPGVTIIPDDGEDEGEEPADPIVTEAPTPTPDTKNTCQKEVTCTQCNTPCSEGDPRMCRTCSTEDNSCSFREACGTGDDDPIYKSTCGKGDFIDESRQQRKEGAQGYAHVKCTGTSVCTGGPNADGLYWCVQDTSPTKVPGEGCSVEYKTNAPCDTKCGSYLKCGSKEEFQACAETSSCNLKTPTPTTSPVPPDGTDTGTLPAVQVTAIPGACGGHTKIYWTATTSDTSNGYWLYRDTTADFKPSKDNNIAGNISPNKTAESPYYDWLGEPGKTYYYRIIASGTQGNTKWSNAAQTLTSTACGSKATSPAQPISPEGPSNPGAPGGPGNPTPADWMTNCSASQGRGRGCACTQNTQCTNGWCNGGKCHYADTTTNCPATSKPQACVCETNAQCTSGWCNGGKCN